MADGYNLEVKADLDWDAYLKKLNHLVDFTSVKGQAMENSLVITPRLNDKRFQAQLAKLDTADVKNIDTDVDLDTAKAEAEYETFIKTASAKEINVKVDTHSSVADIQGMATQLTIASRAAEQFVGRLGTISIVAGAAGLAVASITTAVVGGIGISAASTIEQAQVSLQALIGDVPKANSLLKDFKTEADISPFELKDYSVTAAKFASATDDVVEIKKRTIQAANAAAQYGGDIQLVGKALADVSNKGKLAGQEVIQFANAGIPIQGLVARFLMLNGTIEKMPLDKAIVEVGKLQEEGKITAQVVRDAIDRALDPNIAEKFSKTLKGRLSTLKDAFKNAAAAFVGVDISNFTGETIVNPGGFYDTLGKSVTSLADTFNSADFKTPLEEAGTVLGTAFAGLAEHLPMIISLLGQFVAVSAEIIAQMVVLGTEFLTAFGPRIQQGMSFVADHAETIAKVLGGLVVGGVLLKIGGALIGLVTPFINLAASIGKVGSFLAPLGTLLSNFVVYFQVLSLEGTGVFSAIGTAATTALGPIGLIVAAVVTVGAALVSAYTSSKKLREGLFDAFKVVGTGISEILDGLKDIFTGLFSLIKPIGEALAPVFNVLVGAFGGLLIVVGYIVQAFGAVFKILGPIVGFIGKLLIVFQPISLLIKLIQWAWEKWGDQVKIVWGYVSDFFKEVGKWFGKATKWVEGAISDIENFASKIPIIGDNFKKSGEESKKALETTSKAAEKTGFMVDNIKKKTEEFTDGFKSFLKEGLPPLDVTSLDTLSKSFDDQSAAMKKKLDDVNTLIDAGYIDLVSAAFDVGGEQGAGMITNYAQAIKDGKPQVLDETRAMVNEQAKVLAEVEFMRKAYEKKLEKQFTLSLFDTKGFGAADYNKFLAELNKEGDLTIKQIAKKSKKLLDEYGIDPNSAGGKALINKLRDDNQKFADEQEKARKEQAKEFKKKFPQPAFTDVPKKEVKTTKTEPAPAGSFPTGGTGPLLGTASLAGKGVELATGLFDGFTGFFKDKDIFGSLKNALSNGVAAIGSFIGENVFPLGGKVVSAIKDGISNALTLGGDIFGSIKSAISSGISSIVSKFTELKNSIANKAGEVFAAAQNVGSSIWNGIVNGLSSAAGAIGDIGNRIWQAVRSIAKSGFDRVRSFEAQILNVKFKPFANFPGLASGTNNWQGGMATVGERGREDVYLPRGTRVVPAHKSKDKSTSVINNFNSTINGVSFEQASAEWEAKIRAQRRQVFV